MNICLISDRQIYKFVLNYEMNLKYIKKLCYKIFKTEDLDIYYKDKKIFEKYSEDTILDDIVNAHDSIIKFKIIFHSFCSSKNQTPSTTNSQTTNTIDIGRNHNNENKKKKFEIKSIINLKQNKLFEAVFTHKFKKLSSLMDEFNIKVIEMERFLFKKKDFSEKNHATFEKKIYEFVEGVTKYYQKLISILEKNNYASYDEIVHNLRYFYDNIVFNEEKEVSKNIKENEQIIDYKTLHNEDNFTINSSKNKFPINLKKSEKIATINAEKSNIFNKKSKKITIKDKLLSNEKTDSKISFLNKRVKNDVFDIMEAKDTSNKIIINITDLTDRNIKKKIKFEELDIKKVDSEEKNNKKEIKGNLNIKTEKEDSHIDNREKVDKLSTSGDLFKKTSNSLKKIVDIKNKTSKSIISIKSQKSDESKKIKNDKKIIKNDNNNKNDNIKKKDNFKKNDNNKKNSINDKKEPKNKINNIKTSIFKFEADSENENENNSNSSEKSAKNMNTNYKNKLVFNSTIKESESEECSNRILDYNNSSKNEEDNKSEGILDENGKKDKKRIDKLKKSLSKKKSLNPNILNIMKLSSKEDEEEDAKKRLKPVTYHFSQNNLNYARTLSKKLLKKKTKTNLQNKFDFII